MELQRYSITTDTSIGQPPIGTQQILEQSVSLRIAGGAQAMVISSSSVEQLQPQRERAMVLTKESDAVVLFVPPVAPGAENVTALSVDTPNKGQKQIEVPNVVQRENKKEKNALSSFYGNLINVIYDSILKESSAPKDTFCKLDLCCQAVDYIGLCKKKNGPYRSVNDLSSVLRRGRSKGWLLHRNMIFPLASTAGRTVWVTAEFIAVFFTLGLSIARYSCGNNYIFNTVHLALSIFTSFLALIDVIAVFTGLIMKCCRAISRKTAQENSRNEATTSTAEKVARCCKKCVKNKFDVGRMVLSELIFYPLLICAMFDMILFESYFFDTEANQISFVLFIMSAILMLGFVYIPRIAVPLNAMCNLQKKRYFERSIDISNTKSSIHFQNYFILHSLGQIVSQVVMIAGIGILIHAENAHFVKDCLADETAHVSVSLWYTLVAGYILPFLGLLTFILATYYWLQEFPIGISVDFLSIISLPNITEILDMPKEGREKINKIIGHFYFPQLKQEFDEIHGKSWCYKIAFPFQSPSTVIFSFLFILFYTGFFAASYISLAYFAVDGEVDHFHYYFLCAVGTVVCIMNFFTISVVIFWVVVIALVIFVSFCAFAIVIAILGLISALFIFVLILGAVLCMMCASSSNNQPRRRY